MDAADSNAARLEALQLAREKLTAALIAPNTRRGYFYDWTLFTNFCKTLNAPSLPASQETVSLYVTDALTRGLKVSTVTRRVAAVAHEHRAHNHVSPVTSDTRELLRCAKRLWIQPVRRVRPLSTENVRAIAELLAADDTPVAVRNRCIIVIGFASALRTANLAALRFADIEFTEQGVILQLGREKQKQEGGREIGLPPGQNKITCPVGTLREWIARRGIFAGPLFTRFDGGSKHRALMPERIGQLVQQQVARIGLDPKLYGGHSLRAGMITEAGENNVGELLIAATSGHRDMATLRQYFRHRDLFRANATAALGL